MFGSMEFSLGNLAEEDRVKLADLLEARSEYYKQLVVHNSLRVAFLRNPTPENEARMSDFGSTVIAPLRDAMTEPAMELLQRAVDIDKLKSMIPMLVMVLMQSINVPLLLTTIGLDVDQVQGLVERIREYIKLD